MASHIVEKASKSGAAAEDVKYLKRMEELADKAQEREDDAVADFFGGNYCCDDPDCYCNH